MLNKSVTTQWVANSKAWETERFLYDLYAVCLSVMPTDCMDVSNSSSGNSRKVIMCSGLKMLKDILIWSVGGS